MDFDVKPGSDRRVRKTRHSKGAMLYVNWAHNGVTVEKAILNKDDLTPKQLRDLESNNTDGMNYSVTYSLNRKGRFKDICSAADLVANAPEDPAQSSVFGVDQLYGCNRCHKYKAYHKLEPNRKLRSKYCSTPRGGGDFASLSGSTHSKTDGTCSSKKDADERPQIRYAFLAPHPDPHLFAGWIFRKSHPDYWQERGRREYKRREDDTEDLVEDNSPPTPIPKRAAFTLADFIEPETEEDSDWVLV